MIKRVSERAVMAAAAVLIAGSFAGRGMAADVRLEIIPAESTLMQDGVLVGDLVLTNTSPADTFVSWTPLCVMDCSLSFLVEPPDGRLRAYCGNPAADYYFSQRIRLGPGEYVKKPICLLIHEQRYIFDQAGRYRVKAEFHISGPGVDDRGARVFKAECVDSPWVEIEVTASGFGHESYLESHDLFTVVDAFRGIHDLNNWYVLNANRIDEFQDYAREQAKIMIYNWGNGRVLSCIVWTRDMDPKIVAEAQAGLEFAKRYNIGVDMWEYIADRVQHPEKINSPDGIRIYPRNEYYF
jgi:hypothetical protein